MADASEPNNSSSVNGMDEFDEMMNETTEAGQASESLMSDDEAIDKLLDDNTLDDENADMDEFAEIDKLFEDDETSSAEDIVDEFADDEPEPDEFSDESESEVEVESEEIAEFDITAEDDVADTDEHADSAQDEQSEDTTVPEAETITDEAEPAPVTSAAATHNVQDAALAAITAQLALLQKNQEATQQQLSDLQKQETSEALTQQLDGLESSQKTLKQKILKLENNKPTIAYIGLGVAIVALLLGGGLGLVGFSADSKVDELTETVVPLEEQVDFLVQQNPAKKLETVIKRLDKTGSDVAFLKTQLADVQKKMEQQANQDEIDKLKNQLAQLNEQNLEMGELVESLQQQLNTFTQRKKTKIVKARKKSVVKPQNWQVNLIAYRQQWYARRKATEFSKLGVPVQVAKVRINGDVWYRLKVEGFKSKSAAIAYADKVKKRLNLPAVWVNKQK